MSNQALAQPQRLHPLSFVFLIGSSLKKFLVPTAAILFWGHEQSYLVMSTLVASLGFLVWALVRTRAYHYHIQNDELLVREGLLDKTDRHIPLARIQNVTQRRKLLHRLLGVTELRLESAAGGKPEAVMRVLGLQAAQSLEAVLRGTHGTTHVTASNTIGTQPSSTVMTPGQLAVSTVQGTQQLLQLPPGEILRLGLISDRGTWMMIFLIGAVSQHDTVRHQAGLWLQPVRRWLAQFIAEEAASLHWPLVLLAVVVAFLLGVLLLRFLSVALAFYRYHGFQLQREGEKLIASHGLGTQVRAAVRLPRLQSWQLDESWLHRRFSRCRLGVSVAGHTQHHSHVMEPSMQFDELAPIATPQKAKELLSLCLPELQWDALQWHGVQRAMARRLYSQARWMVLGVLALWWMDAQLNWALPPAGAACVTTALLAVTVYYAWAWAQFAAYARCGNVLLFRSGVWHRRWDIVVTSRLQSVRLHSAPLDRRLGIATLQADTQGGSKRRRALNIPCMGRSQAEALQAHLWSCMQHPMGEKP